MTSKVPYFGMSFPDNNFECHAPHTQRILCVTVLGDTMSFFFLSLPRTTMEGVGYRPSPAGDPPQGQVLLPTSHYNSPNVNLSEVSLLQSRQGPWQLPSGPIGGKTIEYHNWRMIISPPLQKSGLRCTPDLSKTTRAH